MAGSMVPTNHKSGKWKCMTLKVTIWITKPALFSRFCVPINIPLIGYKSVTHTGNPTANHCPAELSLCIKWLSRIKLFTTSNSAFDLYKTQGIKYGNSIECILHILKVKNKVINETGKSLYYPSHDSLLVNENLHVSFNGHIGQSWDLIVVDMGRIMDRATFCTKNYTLHDIGTASGNLSPEVVTKLWLKIEEHWQQLFIWKKPRSKIKTLLTVPLKSARYICSQM